MTTQMEPQLMGLGQRFQQARRALNLSEHDVATRLHLKTNIITTIENEAFKNSPPLTFMRGYVRSYARLLNFSEEQVGIAIKELEDLFPKNIPSSTPTKSRKHANHHSHPYIRGMTFVVVLVLGSLVGIWWKTQHIPSPKKNLAIVSAMQQPIGPALAAVSANPIPAVAEASPQPPNDLQTAKASAEIIPAQPVAVAQNSPAAAPVQTPKATEPVQTAEANDQNPVESLLEDGTDDTPAPQEVSPPKAKKHSLELTQRSPVETGLDLDDDQDGDN